MLDAAEVRRCHTQHLQTCAGKEAIQLRVDQQLAAQQAELARLERQLVVYKEAAALLNIVAEKAQESVRAQFEEMVTHALQYVWGPEHSFAISWVRSGSSSAVEFKLRRAVCADGEAGHTEVDISRDSGGMRDVIALVLRIAYLQRVGHAGIMVLDEPFSQVDADKIDLVAQLVSSLQSELGIQILFVTHNSSLVNHADRVVLVEQPEFELSKVTVVR